MILKRLVIGDGQHEPDHFAIEFGHLFQIAHGEEGGKTCGVERAGNLLGLPIHGKNRRFICGHHVLERGVRHVFFCVAGCL